MKTRLSEDEKVFIVKNFEIMTVGRIGQLLSRSRSTVESFRKRWLNENRFINHKPSGASGKLTTSILKRIEKFIRLYPETTIQKIKNQFNLSVCRQTLSKYLHSLGFSKFRMRKKPRLTNLVKEQRLNFALSHRNWTERRWSTIIFSDESSFEFNKAYPRYAWRKRGEGLLDSHYIPTKPCYGKRYVKVWSFMCAEGVGPIVFIEDGWNRFAYREILENNLLENARGLLGNQFIFQQDGDTVHNSAHVREWLEQNQIRTLQWPSHSSDLSPIENLWNIVKANLAKTEHSNIDDFKEAIRIEWSNLDRNILRNLIFSMPRRLLQVIRKNGAITKY